MRLILHIGMHKTGTSSIQDTMFSIYGKQHSPYIHFGMPNSSLAIIKGFSNTFRDRPGVKAQNLNDGEIEARRIDARSLINKTLKEFRGELGVISAEEFSTLTYEEFSDFVDFVSPYCNSIEVIGYVRSPHSYVQSVFQQRLKKSRQTFSYPKVNVRYKSFFEKFDGILGRENVTLREFSPDSLYNGCVVQDFFDFLGMGLEERDIVRTNDSLSFPAVQLLYIYRLLNPIVKTGDMEIVEKLSKLEGEKFTLSDNVLGSLAKFDAEDILWMESRLGRSLDAFRLESGNDFQSERDFLKISDECLDWLKVNTSYRYNPKDIVDLNLISHMVSSL